MLANNRRSLQNTSSYTIKRPLSLLLYANICTSSNRERKASWLQPDTSTRTRCSADSSARLTAKEMRSRCTTRSREPITTTPPNSRSRPSRTRCTWDAKTTCRISSAPICYSSNTNRRTTRTCPYAGCTTCLLCTRSSLSCAISTYMAKTCSTCPHHVTWSFISEPATAPR